MNRRRAEEICFGCQHGAFLEVTKALSFASNALLFLRSFRRRERRQVGGYGKIADHSVVFSSPTRSASAKGTLVVLAMVTLRGVAVKANLGWFLGEGVSPTFHL